MISLDKWEELLKEATAGPWTSTPNPHYPYHPLDNHVGSIQSNNLILLEMGACDILDECPPQPSLKEAQANTRLILACRNHLPDLIWYIRGLQRQKPMNHKQSLSLAVFEARKKQVEMGCRVMCDV